MSQPPSSDGHEPPAQPMTLAASSPTVQPRAMARTAAAAATRASRAASPAPPAALPQSELAVTRSSHSRLGSPALSRRSSSGLQHLMSGSNFAFPPLAAAALGSAASSGLMHAPMDSPSHPALFPPLSHPLSRAHSHASPTALSFGPQQYETSPQLFPGSAGLPSARHGPVSPAPFDASHAGALALEPHSLTPTRGPRPEPQGLPHSALDVDFQLPSPPLSRPVSAAGGRIDSMLGVNMNRRNSIRRVSLSAADLGLSGHFAASGMAGLEVSLLTDTGDADADADEIADGAAFSRMPDIGGDVDGMRAMEGAEGFDHTENELHSLAALHSSALLLSAAHTSNLDSRSSGGGFSMISADGNSRVDLSPTTFSASRNTRTPPLLRSPAGSRSLPSVLPPPSPTQFAAAMPSSLSSPSPVLAATAAAASSAASPSHHSPPLSSQVPAASNLPSPVLLRHSNDEQDLLLHYPLLFDVDWQEEEGQSPSALHSLDSPNAASSSPSQSSSWPHALPPKGSPVRMGVSPTAAAMFAAIGSHSTASSVHSSPLAQSQRGSFGFSPTSAASSSAPILSPSSQQRKHEQARDSALRHRSLPSAISLQPAASASTDALTQLKVPGVLEEDCGMFSQAVGWAASAQHASEAGAHAAAAAGGQAAAAPTAELAAQPASADVCSPHLARLLVCSIGDMAHDSLLSSPSLTRLELLIDKFAAAQLEMHEASLRERRRERTRVQTESSVPPASIASRRNTTAGMASSPTISPAQSRRRMSLTASAAAAAAVAFSTSARRSSNGDLQFADPRESSASPAPPPSHVQFELPLPAKLALQQVCDLLLQMAAPDCPHPELSIALLDVLHLVLQRECPLSLANSLSQPNADVEECWLPLWQWLHAAAVDETRTLHTRSQAMDTLLLLALARGSLFMLLHLLSALLIPSSASLKIPAASLMLVSEYCKLVHATPEPQSAVHPLMRQLPLMTLVDTSSAAVIIAAYMQALNQSGNNRDNSACPLFEEHLSAAHLSSSNPNNQGVSYRALCVDTSLATMTALLQLFQELYDRVQQLRETADAGKGEESTEAELRNLVAVLGALLPIIAVHCHQIALQDSGHREEQQAILLPNLASLQSLLALYPAAAPLLAELGSPTAFCLAFAVPLLWPSFCAQLAEVTRVLSVATAAWRDPTTHYASPSELLLARLMLRRLSGFSFAQQLVYTVYPRARQAAAGAGKDASDDDPDSDEPFSSAPQRVAVVESFIAQLVHLIEAAAAFTMTPSDATARLEPVQWDLVQTAVDLLECIQQQLLCVEMQQSLADQQARSTPPKATGAEVAGDHRVHSQSTADAEEKSKLDDEDESTERADAIHAPPPTTVAFPPTLPQLPYRDEEDSFLIRFAPMVISTAEKLTARAVSLARQRNGTQPNTESPSTAAAGLYLQLLRSLVQPLILTSCKLCTPLRPSFSLAILPPLTSFVEGLSRLSPLLLRLVARSPASSARTVCVLQTFESAHPYRPFSDKEVVVSLPTASTPHLDALVYPPSEVRIRFDVSKCATHTKYDYVELFAVQPAFKDARSISEAFAAQTHAPVAASVSATTGASMPLKAASLSDRWSGAHVCGSWHWPTEELVFHNQHVLLQFCTAATTRPAVIAEENSSYFGYRVTVESTYQLSPRFVDRASTRLPRWFSHTMQAAAWLAASSAAALIKAEPTSESETRSYQWLRSFLFSAGFEKAFVPQIRAAPSSSLVLPRLSLSVPGSEATSTGPSAHASHKHSRAASFNATSFSAMANAAAASAVSAPSRAPADDSVASQHQCFLDHLCMSESARSLSLHPAATRVHDLLKKLAATGVDRQIIQRSVAAAAAQCTSSLFAVLLKHYGRVADALACAESEDRPVDPFLARLWRKASEIKMDIRTEQSATQDVTQLVTHILQRTFFLLQLAPASGSAEIEARDGSIIGLNMPDLLRRQTSSGSVSSATRQRSESEMAAALAAAATGSSIPPSPSRVSVSRAPSLWNKDRIMSKLLRNTVRSMRIVKQLLRLRTRAADDSSAHSEEALARSVLTFVRDKTDTSQLLSLSMEAVAAQHSRATYRLTGLQAVHQLAKRLLALRSVPHSSFREGDSPVSLSELCLSQVSRALRALPGSVRPAASHLSLPPPPLSSPMHLLFGVDSVGLELRSFIFNEYYAFIGSFLELATHTAAQPTTSSTVSPILSVSPTQPPLLPLSCSAHLHLLHLCAVNFEWVKTTPLLPAGGLDSWLGGASSHQRAGSLTRSHDMFALSRLGILQFLRPLTALLRAPSVSEWSLDSSVAPPSSSVSRAAAPSDVAWSVSFSAWALFRLLAYASAPAVSGWSDVDAGALEVSAGVMEEVRVQLQANQQLMAVTASSSEPATLHLSLADASIAWHLHALQAMQTHGAMFASPAAGAATAVRNVGSAFSSPRSSPKLAPASLVTPLVGLHPESLARALSRQELLQQRTQLLWVVARCCQSATFCARLASSAEWVALLFKLAPALDSPALVSAPSPAPSSSSPLPLSFRSALAAYKGSLAPQEGALALGAVSGAEQLGRTLVLHILGHVLPLVSPRDPMLAAAAAPSVSTDSLAPEPDVAAAAFAAPFASPSRARSFTFVNASASSKFTRIAVPFINSLLDRVGAFCVLSCTGARLSASEGVEASQLVGLLRTLLACPTVLSQAPTPLAASAAASSAHSDIAFSPVSPLLSGASRSMGEGGGAIASTAPSAADLKRIQSDWQEAMHLVLCMHIERLKQLQSHQLGDAAVVSNVSRLLASLWILGGGQCVLGEGSRVRTELDGLQRTGTIIRRIKSQPTTEMETGRDEQWNRQIEVSGLAEDDVLFEVVLDVSAGAGSDAGSSALSSDAEPGVHSPQVRSAGAPLPAPSVAVGDSWQLRDVYHLYASTLLAIDSVPVPLAQLSIGAASDIVEAIGALLRTSDNQQKVDQSIAQWSQDETNQAQKHTNDDPASAPSPSIGPSLHLSPSSQRLLWSDVEHRAIQALSVLIDREDIAALVMHQGISPLLVPIAIRPIALAARSGSSAAEPSSGDGSPVEPNVASLEADSASLSITELELRIALLQRCICARTHESAASASHRRRLWNSLDTKLHAERRLQLKQQDDRRRAELARLPPLTLAHAAHPHVLHFFSTVYDGSYDCERCGRTKSGGCYHCAACKFDMCLMCAGVAQTQGSTAGSPASSVPPSPLLRAAVTSPDGSAHSPPIRSPALVPSGPSIVAVSTPVLRPVAADGQQLDASKAMPGSRDSSDDALATLAGRSSKPTSPQTKRAASEARDKQTVERLQLLGFPESLCQQAVQSTPSESAAVSWLLDQSDCPSCTPLQPSADWTLFPGGYTVPSSRLPEGWPRIRAFLASYTEDGTSGGRGEEGGDVDSFGRRTGPTMRDAQDSRTAHKAPSRPNSAGAGSPLVGSATAVGSTSGSRARKLKGRRDVNYNHVSEHDARAHRAHYGAWKEALLHAVSRQEFAELEQTATQHRQALAVLYARKCSLLLLHALKDQLAEQAPPEATSSARRLSVATLAAHTAAVRIGVPVAARAGVTGGEAATTLDTAPPFLRRTASVAHALSSFGPVGFLATFISLLCSAPHQLATPFVSGDGRRTGLAHLGIIVHTILLAERQRVQAEAQRFINAARFKTLAPIARHLLQGSLVHMMSLCRPDVQSSRRHALLNTVSYTFDAFLALEESHVWHAPGAPPAVPSSSIFRASPRSSGTFSSKTPTASESPIAATRANMLIALFSTPVCLLMLEVIASASFALSPSSLQASAAAAAGLSDDYIGAMPTGYIHALERQRLLFVRLLARILLIRTRSMHSCPSLWHDLHRNPTERAWTATLHRKCSRLRSLCGDALEDERLAGRGSMTVTSFPHTFFSQALVNLSLVWARYERAWEALEIEIELPRRAPSPTELEYDGFGDLRRDSSGAPLPPLPPLPPRSASPSPSGSPSSELVDIASTTQSAQSSLSASPLEPVDGTRIAVARASRERARDEHKSRWFSQLVLLDRVLTYLRDRPRGVAPSKSGRAPSPSGSPSASPATTRASSHGPSPGHAVFELAAVPSDTEVQLLPAAVAMFMASPGAAPPSSPPTGSYPQSSPPHLSISSVGSAGGSSSGVASLSPSSGTDLVERSPSPINVSDVIRPIGSAAPRSWSASPDGPRALPVAFVELFWERMQKDMFDDERKERVEAKTRAMHSSIDEYWRRERDSELECARAPWVCSTCTFASPLLSSSCDMCGQPRPSAASISPPAETQVYFELSIVSQSKSSVGVGLALSGYPSDNMPGWSECSYGYHGDDGCIFGPTVQGQSYGPTYSAGDTVGVGYAPFKREIFFTLNGRHLGVAFRDVEPLDFRVAVGCHSKGDCVQLNTGQKPFVYKHTSSKLIRRPDVHWAAAREGFEMHDLLQARWGLHTCGSILSQAALLYHGRPAPVHSEQVSYFEVAFCSDLTLDTSSGAHPPCPCVAVGLAPSVADLSAPTNTPPGWSAGSYGYQGDNGCLYHSSDEPIRSYGPIISPGDVLGCGFDRAKREVFFTLNGRHLGVAFAQVPDEPYFATVALYHSNDQLTVNFGATPFVYAAIKPRTSDSANSLSPLSEGEAAESALHAAIHFSHPLSPPHNTLGAHSSCLSVSALSARHVSPSAALGLAQSSLPVVSVSPEQALLDLDAATHPAFSPLPVCLFDLYVSSVFGPLEDEELVLLLNRRAEKLAADDQVAGEEGGLSPMVIDATKFEITPEERATYALLNNISERNQQDDSVRSPRCSVFQFRARVSFLQCLNSSLASALPLVNLSKPAKRGLFSKHFRDPHVRSLFFCGVKRALIRAAVAQTCGVLDSSRPPFTLRLDLFKSQKLVMQGRVDVLGTRTLFGQAFQQLHLHRHDEENKYGDPDRDPTRMMVRWRQKAWRTVFKGMYADDYGGMYRDASEKMCSELQSPLLPLFIPCPNAREQIGENRNHWVPNPSSTHPLALEMYEFLGKLMGLALRSGDLLSLDFPGIVWKSLVDDPVSEDDVQAIDRLSFRMLHELRKLEAAMQAGVSPISPAEFSEYIDSSFVVVGSDMRRRELVPGGERIPVTWSNRDEFVAALLWFRKHEFKLQCGAMRRGLAQVIPISLLSILTWQELRDQICGNPIVDVNLLRRLTVYEGCCAHDPHIVSFWHVMTQRLDHRERAKFIQFVWGRSRLPSVASEFERKLKIQAMHHNRSGANPDDYLPVAHTCFFSLELPRYSCVDVLHRKLLYAINNCVAIDSDSTEQAQQAGRTRGDIDSDEEEAI